MMDKDDPKNADDSSQNAQAIWEQNVYGRGRQLNLYPDTQIVGLVMRRFANVDDRSAVKILELGCGAGNNLWFAAREGFSVAGIDFSPTAIEFAKERFRKDKLPGDLRVGTFTEIPWPDGTFDVVFDRGALSCGRRREIAAALDECRRVLKPRGAFWSVGFYTDEHPGRQFGRDLGDGSYDEFRGGYFAGLGTIHFADEDEVRQVFGARFHLTRAVRHQEFDVIGNSVVTSYWRIEGEKE